MTYDSHNVERENRRRQHHLVFVAPDSGLLTPRFLELAERLQVSTFAIDEAHCISQWGHDFRPEYRQLATLKTRVRRASLHAYTATCDRTRACRHHRAARAPGANGTGGSFRIRREVFSYRVRPKLDVNAQIAVDANAA